MCSIETVTQKKQWLVIGEGDQLDLSDNQCLDTWSARLCLSTFSQSNHKLSLRDSQWLSEHETSVLDREGRTSPNDT